MQSIRDLARAELENAEAPVLQKLRRKSADMDSELALEEPAEQEEEVQLLSPVPLESTAGKRATRTRKPSPPGATGGL
jgi:hypothetical protein